MHRSWRGSQSGFPLLTPIMETYDGPAWRLISTLCGESATRNLANRSLRIQDVYVGAVPIPQFIKKKSPDTFDDSFTSTTCLYLSPSQLCLIKRENDSNFKVSYLNLGYSYSTFS